MSRYCYSEIIDNLLRPVAVSVFYGCLRGCVCVSARALVRSTPIHTKWTEYGFILKADKGQDGVA